MKVPFPYTNRPVQQRRPALVVAVPDVPGAPRLLWVLMVTSAGNRAWPGDVVVSDLAEAGLPAASVVRPAKIATVEAGEVERIGCLPRADRSQVEESLRYSLRMVLAGVGPAAGHVASASPVGRGGTVS